MMEDTKKKEGIGICDECGICTENLAYVEGEWFCMKCAGIPSPSF